ncbi:hypothetical protein FOV68_11410 [Pantoea sp. paga]|nr:hypothetical protein FOV68_11410 [Pantoea sp. paga]
MRFFTLFSEGYGRIYASVTGYVGNTAPFSIGVTLSVIRRLHAAKAALTDILRIVRRFCR